MGVFHTVGGAVDQTAVIGHPPEDRNWRPGDPCITPVIHHTARVEAFVTIDAGSKRATTIGARCHLLKHTHIGHDVWLGDDVTVACGAVIGGHCTIGDGAFIGLNATIAPYRTIGAHAQVEQGSNVIHDVPAGARVGGNPARLLPPRRTDKFADRSDRERVAKHGPQFEGEDLRAA